MPAQKNKQPFFLFFLISLLFIMASLYIYSYLSSKISKELVVDNSPSFYTPTITNIPTPSVIPTEPTEFIPETPTESLESTSTPTEPYLKTFYSDIDKFEVTYLSTRQLYEDKGTDSNRYVFVRTEGNNFVVHVGRSWSWIHPDRQFTDDQIISGLNTFRYDTRVQTVVDLQKDDFKYTLQCVHNGIDSLKSECQDFIQSFKLID
ncbi:hypothetical protein KKE45_03790 [Patescibacteria group bacterium]|nr:hypothetical protein [Patescibacteria group bacterium]